MDPDLARLIEFMTDLLPYMFDLGTADYRGEYFGNHYAPCVSISLGFGIAARFKYDDWAHIMVESILDPSVPLDLYKVSSFLKRIVYVHSYRLNDMAPATAIRILCYVDNRLRDTSISDDEAELLSVLLAELAKVVTKSIFIQYAPLIMGIAEQVERHSGWEWAFRRYLVSYYNGFALLRPDLLSGAKASRVVESFIDYYSISQYARSDYKGAPARCDYDCVSPVLTALAARTDLEPEVYRKLGWLAINMKHQELMNILLTNPSCVLDPFVVSVRRLSSEWLSLLLAHPRLPEDRFKYYYRQLFNEENGTSRRLTLARGLCYSPHITRDQLLAVAMVDNTRIARIAQERLVELSRREAEVSSMG